MKLTAAVEVSGTAVPAQQELPAYRAAAVTDVSDAEFAVLLGRPIPGGRWTGEIDINDPLSRLGDAKSALARGIFKGLNRKMEQSSSDGMLLYIFHMPLRAIAKTTGGMITENMIQDFLDICNGHGFTGIPRLIGHNFSDKRKIKAYRKKLEQ